MSLLDRTIYNTFSTEKAEFYIAGNSRAVTHIGFAREFYPVEWIKDENAFPSEISDLIAFFRGEKRTLDIPYVLEGTDFQKLIWQTIAKIPYGETRSYKEVAMMAGRPNAQRAVGNVCNKNRLLLLVPCHRVVAAHGLGGYGGNLEAKKWLLNNEKENK
ncbi:MAG: methylated-DNA--[protein]-cysteine S-methyltransferase [Eubacteriales bacterium]